MQNLQFYRETKKKLKLTNKEISEVSGIPQRTVEDFFRGAYDNPRIDTVLAIERALGIRNSITEEERAAGAVESANISVSPQIYEWMELGENILEQKGEAFFESLKNVLREMTKKS